MSAPRSTTDHLCDFLPKFHCELAPVECFWGYAKRNCRISCDYSIHGLRDAVPKYLSEVPLASITGATFASAGI